MKVILEANGITVNDLLKLESVLLNTDFNQTFEVLVKIIDCTDEELDKYNMLSGVATE